MRTLQELAKEALDVQDTCNLSGVVHSFSRVMTELRPHCSGTGQLNTHPICVLFADKIRDLTHHGEVGVDWMDTVGNSYNWCRDQLVARIGDGVKHA
jgi:hypothetical protein